MHLLAEMHCIVPKLFLMKQGETRQCRQTTKATLSLIMSLCLVFHLVSVAKKDFATQEHYDNDKHNFMW